MSAAAHRILIRDEDSRREIFVANSAEDPGGVIYIPIRNEPVGGLRRCKRVETRAGDESTDHVYVEIIPLQ